MLIKIIFPQVKDCFEIIISSNENEAIENYCAKLEIANNEKENWDYL